MRILLIDETGEKGLSGVQLRINKTWTIKKKSSN